MEDDDLDLLFDNVPDYEFDENESIKYEESEPAAEEPDLYAYELYHSEHVERLPPMAPRNARLMKKLHKYSKHIAEMTKDLESCAEQTAQLRVFEALRGPDDKVTLAFERFCTGARFTVIADPEFFEGPFTVVIRFQSHKPKVLTVQRPITLDDKGKAQFFLKDFPEDAKVESAELCVCSTIDEVLYDKMLKMYNKLMKKHDKQPVEDPEPPPPKRRRVRQLTIYDALAALCIDRNEIGTSPEAWAPLLGEEEQPADDIKDVKPDKNELDVDEEDVVIDPLPSDLKYDKRYQVSPLFDESESSELESEEEDDGIKREIFDYQPVVFDPTKLFESEVDPTTELMPIVHSIPIHISTR